ncbi:MAG: arylamine N-acetyltransferase [Proteobacteria bacterium]|nr:arylamine N-acetyltransferase [Pseudomonadota bacterium]
MPLDIQGFLDRIGFDGPIDGSLGCLASLKTAFLQTVPFENIDIHIPRQIQLSPERAEAKIVGERRGGFCYECNGLLYDILFATGYDVKMCSAQMYKEKALSPPFEHMVLIVSLEGAEYLVDVGNGESVRQPLDINKQEVSWTPEGKNYRLGRFDDALALEVQEQPETAWQTRFTIDTTSRSREEFAERCVYQQTSEDSVFTTRPLATLALPDGRRTLRGNVYKEQRIGELDLETVLTEEAAYYDCLSKNFGLSFLDEDRKFWPKP